MARTLPLTKCAAAPAARRRSDRRGRRGLTTLSLMNSADDGWSGSATRRRFLRVAAAGAASMAVPAWAGETAQRPLTASFTFAVANDLHYRDARCGDWLQRVADHV